MFKPLKTSLHSLPTPVAGLALGIASLGACLEYTLPLQGAGQNTGALIAAVMLLALTVKFCCYPALLAQDLRHAVIGSVLPTYAMGWMIVAKALSLVWLLGGNGINVAFMFIGHFHLAPRPRFSPGAYGSRLVRATGGDHCRRCSLSRRHAGPAGAYFVKIRHGKLRRPCCR
ncbi:hypothetical protein [Candidatus Sodalis endolongispinus]|uniref:hypothetical protein n=1 Tax=Candidatus Sodalis endolongispinus TaxID=2812662 RepID=UPI0028AEBCFA|nr:hypothetical protein [Candidatus Sodalis endolongispinus]